MAALPAKCSGRTVVDLAVEACVASAVDFAHAAGADRGKDLVGAQPRPGG